jgi:hypothetical protein
MKPEVFMGDGFTGAERRTKALEIAVAILGPMEKEDIEKANKNGKEIINHYFWLLKTINEFIDSWDLYFDIEKQS